MAGGVRAPIGSRPGSATAATAGLVLLTFGASAGAALLIGRLLDALPSTLDAAAVLSVDRWVEVVVTAAGSTAALWLALGGCLALVCVVAARLGHAWRAGEVVLRRATPGAVHRLARVAVGVGVGTGLVLVPATAHASDAEGPATPDGAAVTTFDLGWQPTNPWGPHAGPSDASPTHAPADATTDAPPEHEPQLLHEQLAPIPTPTHSPAPPRAGGDHTVVHRGDTLWAIASAALGEGASDGDVLRAVGEWHHTNRDVIGDDPDVILPGQVLRAPTPA